MSEKNLTKGELARSLFQEGANCAQAVAVAFADECGMSREELARLASGFGAGMGRMREVCGAVSGMVLAANQIWGPEDLSDKSGKDAQYTRIQELAEKFKAETGSIVCRELLGLEKKKESPISEERTPEYYKKRPCVEMVVLAAEILEQAILDSKN